MKIRDIRRLLRPLRRAYINNKIKRLSETNIEEASKYIFKLGFGYTPDFNHPKTINEKITYLKLHDYYNNPVITQCVDKYRVKEYITEKYSETTPVKVAKLYGVYDRAEDIEWDKLPDKFAIKCNNGGGYNIFCDNKSSLDIKSVSKQINKWLKEEQWKYFAECQYKFVENKVLIEEYLGDTLKTYKFYCFNGEPKFMYVSFANEKGEPDYYLDYFDMDFNHLPISLDAHEYAPFEIECPKNWEDLKKTAKTLSSDFPFVRVDLYSLGDSIYFSEYTFVPTGGHMKLTPEGTDEEWGELLKIDVK